ncbi:urea carboxylase-related aminomethyltransferase [Vibrio sp. JCM 19052]|nr:urea carboxylase-related aminomethyltransferase [Vibrio sp. JCM 19052]
MSKRDLTHNINFFMNVPVTAEGGLTFADGISGAGKYVELKATWIPSYSCQTARN